MHAWEGVIKSLRSVNVYRLLSQCQYALRVTYNGARENHKEGDIQVLLTDQISKINFTD